MSEVAELLVAAPSVGRGPFLVSPGWQDLRAKSNRSRHRTAKRVSPDFVDKFVRMTISSHCAPNFSVRDALRRKSPSSGPRHFLKQRSNTVGGEPATHSTATAGNIFARAYLRPRHHVCDRPLAIREDRRARECALGKLFRYGKSSSAAPSLLYRCRMVICPSVVTSSADQASEYGQDMVNLSGPCRDVRVVRHGTSSMSTHG